MLETEVLKELADKTEIKEYQPNAYIFRQDDPGLGCLFVVVSGLAEILVTNDRGVETVVGLRHPYDFFGETTVLSMQRYPGSVRAKEHLTCCTIKRRYLEDLIHNHPEFSAFFNALLAERMRLLYEEIVAEQSYEAYSSVESPIFRKRVSEIMSYPVITCRMSDKATEASKIMDDRDVSAVVVLDSEKKIRGILTEKNIVKYLVANQLYPVSHCKVERIMDRTLVQIAPTALLGQALVAMIRNRTKNLVVMERDRLAGFVTMTDLIRIRSTGTFLLTQDIESQTSLKGLSYISREIDSILNALIAEKASVREIFEIMSELHEQLSRRIIKLSEERMRLTGWGPPPAEYCWINMGSAARYEQTLRTDQDNALIYDDPEPDQSEAADAYFSKLAEFIVKGHAECGFAKCEENVMATNPKWRKSLKNWVSAIRRCAKSEDTEILMTLLDYHPIWGSMALSETFRDEILKAFEISVNRQTLAKDDFQYNPPLSFLGTFVTEKIGMHKNEIDLKKNGSVQIVNATRIFAAKNRISEPSTFGRLKRLAEIRAISSEDADFFAASFETLMMFRIRENMKKARRGRKPDNYIDPYSLRKRERVILKDALSGVAQLQQLVSKFVGEHSKKSSSAFRRS